MTCMPYAAIPPLPLDPGSLSVLAAGNKRQQAAFDCIVRNRIFEPLAQFRGVLASTIALGIDTPESDLDFLCETKDLDYFTKTIKDHFEHLRDFCLVATPAQSESRCYSFWCEDFEIEVFGSTVRLEAQFGFRHHTVMARLINLGGESFRDTLRSAKLAGIKSEPAIAEILKLQGNPYDSVAALLDIPDSALLQLLRSAT
jgi:hypothetical protein